MVKRIVLFMLCGLVLSASTVFAEDVFVTQRGKKYHTQECRFIQNRNAHKVSKEEATSKGLKPCKCIKPAEVSEVKSNASLTQPAPKIK